MSFERKKDEDYNAYSMRLYKNAKLYGLKSNDIAEILNLEFNMKKGESAHRKKTKRYSEGYEDGYKQGVSENSSTRVYNSVTPKSHIERYQEVIKEYDVAKRMASFEKLQLSKMIREVAPSIAVSEDRKLFLLENDFKIDIPKYCYEPITKLSDNKMIVQITDWHIGYIIDGCKGNYFNYNIAKKRIEKLAYKIKQKAKLYGVNHIYVANTGDMVEHNYMRKNQSQFCEFGLMMQINKATELITALLVDLAEVAVVEYNSLSGNHDRASGDKSQSFKGDNTNVVVNEDVKRNIELASLKAELLGEELHRIIVHDYDPMQDEFFYKVNGKLHKFIHGDGKTNNSSTLIKNEMSMDDGFYHLWKGHLHNFNVISENNGRYILSGGCLSGYNDYSTKFGCSTVASQTLAIINIDGDFEEITDIQLNII